MRFVPAHEAKRSFSRLLDEVGRGGDAVVITRRGKPVAVLSGCRKAAEAHERNPTTVARALTLLEEAPRLGAARRFTREEMHER